MYTNVELKVIDYLKLYKGESGLYIIRAKKNKASVLKNICSKLGLPFKSDVAYLGKGAKLKTTDLYIRSRQEMGWSNFSETTFVKKIGLYLGLDVRDKNNKTLQLSTRNFIVETFDIECKIAPNSKDLLTWETEQIKQLKACLNDKKNNLKST
jgi:hypothetical protein